MKHLFFSVGEPSGDLHAGAVLEKLPGFTVSGIGGDRMIQAGLDPLFHIRDTAVMGFSEVAANYFRLRAIFRQTCDFLRSRKPDLLVLVDYPGFNLRLAAVAKGLHIPVLYYIAPKVWAWGRGRLPKMARTIDRMAVIFPFEENFFLDAGIRATYVGNPVAHIRYAQESREDFFRRHSIPAGSRLLGILPGSRRQEVLRMLPGMVNAGKLLIRQGRFDLLLVSQAPALEQEGLFGSSRGETCCRLVAGDPGPVFAFSDFLFVKSGTATLEAALHEKPFITLYRTAPLSGLMMRLLVKVPAFSMANIQCGKKVVPELFQGAASVENLVAEALAILNDRTRCLEIVNEFKRMKADLLKHSPPESVATIIREMTNG